MPNAIEAETSTSSQVVSVRSGTWSRTWGRPVRAVAAASIWRTSSPNWYGPDLRQLGAGAPARCAALARQRAGRAARQHEVERLDQRRLHRARALAPGRFGEQRGHAAIGSVALASHAADGVEDARQQVVGGDAVAERVVREHEPVAQHVRGEVGDVLGDHVVAPAQQRQRLRGLDHADRPARARRRTRSGPRAHAARTCRDAAWRRVSATA